jgi:hypothetical protein
MGTGLVILFALAMILLAWQYWLFGGGIFRTSSFDKDHWLASEKTADDISCHRGGMAEDIRRNVLHFGQTIDEVTKVLGQPSDVRGAIYSYNLGMCSGMRIDFDSLDVHFDNRGRLKLVQIVQH